ncbi:MAG TPA: MFS transporter [Rubrivivax sp.]|nr:MFS transporter [Rubrivivax sp.]
MEIADNTTHQYPSFNKAHQYPSFGAASYLMAVLIVAGILSYVDRQILSLLVQPIRADLHITDTEFSLLHGFAFAILYAILGLPLGRYADRANRRNLIIAGVVFWSLATIACGLAETYTQLFIARICVGIGEAALAPASVSMICDAYRDKSRGTALGVFNTSIYLGIGVSIVIGGVLLGMIKNQPVMDLPLFGLRKSWQAAFIIVGLPGLLLALFMLTLREPARRTSVAAPPPLSEALAYFRKHRFLMIGLSAGFAFFALAAYGLSAWAPTFLLRQHGWPIPQAAVAYGVAVTIGGTLGVGLSGVAGDWWRNSGRIEARLLLSIGSMVFWTLFVVLAVNASDGKVAVFQLGLAAFCSSVAIGAGGTALQDIVPDWLRGQAIAGYLLILNLLGLGTGPTVVALVTDKVFHSDAALGKSIAAVGVPAIASGILLVLLILRAYNRLSLEQADPNSPVRRMFEKASAK